LIAPLPASGRARGSGLGLATNPSPSPPRSGEGSTIGARIAGLAGIPVVGFPKRQTTTSTDRPPPGRVRGGGHGLREEPLSQSGPGPGCLTQSGTSFERPALKSCFGNHLQKYVHVSFHENAKVVSKVISKKGGGV